MNWDAKQVAGMIDHTNLKAFATAPDLQKLCDEARTWGFKSVMVNGSRVKLCKELLAGTNVIVGTVIAFPLGETPIEAKVAEAEIAIRDGCREFDYVLNIGRLKEHDYAYIGEEMSALVALARKAGVGCKVIFETCYLTEEEIAEAAKIASRVRPDFVKTSTGFGTAGATAAHVALMKQNAGPDVQVKAAGGIRTWADAKAMLEAGATRLGASSGVQIVKELS